MPGHAPRPHVLPPTQPGRTFVWNCPSDAEKRRRLYASGVLPCGLADPDVLLVNVRACRPPPPDAALPNTGGNRHRACAGGQVRGPIPLHTPCIWGGGDGALAPQMASDGSSSEGTFPRARGPRKKVRALHPPPSDVPPPCASPG